jgi:hypothetical protein
MFLLVLPEQLHNTSANNGLGDEGVIVIVGDIVVVGVLVLVTEGVGVFVAVLDGVGV